MYCFIFFGFVFRAGGRVYVRPHVELMIELAVT